MFLRPKKNREFANLLIREFAVKKHFVLLCLTQCFGILYFLAG